jgi:nuclear GTP-binding protein
MTELNKHYSFNEEVMEVETKGPVSMKTDKKSKAKEDLGEGDIIEEIEQVLKADKKKKRKIEHEGSSRRNVFQIAGSQPVNKQNKNLAKKMKKQKVKVDKKISNLADVLDNFNLSGDYDFDENNPRMTPWKFTLWRFWRVALSGRGSKRVALVGES